MNNRRLNILWHSNGPNAPTGYGNQTGLFLPKLIEDYDATLSAFYGIEGNPQVFRIDAGGSIPYDLKVLPRGFNAYGNDVLAAHADYTRADVTITLIDPFAFDRDIAQHFRWCAWVPVDSAPLSPENGHSLMTAQHLWAMSLFGQKQLEHYIETARQETPPTLHYVPHGVDSKVFQPGNRAGSREKLHNAWKRDISGKFIVSTVAANKGYPGRKNWPGMFRVMAAFLAEHPDAMWYVHTNTQIPNGYGDNIPLLMSKHNINPEQVIAPPVYQYVVLGYPPDYLVDVYNASDVFLLLSFGEGFGIPIVEAQMTGCPVIVTDGTSMSELCLAGDKVSAVTLQALDGRQGCDWAFPNDQHAVELLKKHYQLWKNKDTRLRSQARDKALIYDVDTVYSQYMKPAVESIQDAIFESMSDSRRRRKAKKAKQDKALLVVPQPDNGQPVSPTVAAEKKTA